MDVRSRKDLVADLIEARFPLESIRAELKTYPWDLEEPLVQLTAAHIASVLHRFHRGEVSARDVMTWAEALELRDDIGYAEPEQVLQRAVFVLANPEVNGELTDRSAEALLAEIAHRTA